MINRGSHEWRLGYLLAILSILLTGCDLPFLAGSSSGPNISCHSEQPVLLSPISPIADLAVDDQSIFVVTHADPGSISKISRSTGEFQLVTNLGAEPFGIQVDDRSIYWVEGSWQSDQGFFLMKLDKRSREATVLFHSLGPIVQLRMDADYLYWLDSDTSSVWRFSKRGAQVEELLSGRAALTNIAIENGTLFLGGSAGLSLLNPGDETAQSLLTSNHLLQALNIGLRDEYSIYSVGPVLAEHKGEIIFAFYVANYPGMISCTDNSSRIIAFPVEGGSPRLLLNVEGSLVDSVFFAPYLYTLGNCRGGQMVNVETGEVGLTEISYDAFHLVADRNTLFWSDQEGLKCMRRPGLK